jgi:multiple sugar transport system substrate-binding protein
MKHRRLLSSAMAALLVASGMFTVDRQQTAATSSQITIRFGNWVSAEAATRANMNKVIAAFEKLHPTIKVVNIPIPFDQVYSQLVTEAAGRNLPDVIMLNGPWPAEFGGLRLLADLTPLAGPKYLADNYPGALDAGRYNGKLYAVPISLTPHGFWYNKVLMKEAGLNPNKPPRTMAELNADLPILKAKLGAKGVYPIGIDTTKIDYALTEYFPWFYAFGAYPLYNGKPNFNTPQVAASLQWLRTVVKKGYTPVGQQIKDERSLMAEGKIVFKLDGPYLVGILRSLTSNLNGNAFYDTWGVTTVPTGPSGKSVTLADLHQLGIAASSPNKAADWQFVQFLTSSSQSIYQYQVPYGVLPALKSVLKGNVVANPVAQAYVTKIFPTMIGGPYSPAFGKQLPLVLQALQEAALTTTPISQITQQTEQALASIP